MSAPLAQSLGRVLLHTRWEDYHKAGDSRGWLGIFDFAWSLAVEQTAMPTPVDEDEHKLAQRDSEQLGIGFLVDGKYIHPDRVCVLGGVKNVDAMRAAAAEVRDMLAETRRLQFADKTTEAERATEAELVGARIRRLCILCDVPVPDGDDGFMHSVAFTLLGACCYNVGKLKGHVIMKVHVDTDDAQMDIDKALRKIDMNSNYRVPVSRHTMLHHGTPRVDNSKCKFAAGGACCSWWCGDSACAADRS